MYAIKDAMLGREHDEESQSYIFHCGCAHWPADSAEVASQPLGAAARSSVHLARESVSVEPIVSSIWEEELCRGCGMCVALCPYGAIELVETPQGTKARTIAVACKGCGVCGAACYVKAIKMNHYSDQQIEAQIEAFGEAKSWHFSFCNEP